MTESLSPLEATRRDAGDLMRRINRTWLEGRPRDLLPLLHPEIVLAIPGGPGRVQGREVLVKGFVDFCENARVHAYEEHDFRVEVIGATAVASYAFIMMYERDGHGYRSTGTDLWVFTREGGEWLAAWRTMLDVTDEPVQE
jgi:Domain of unknown function (DUF4440)